MFITMCNYPALFVEIATAYYYCFTIIGLLIGCLIGGSFMLNSGSNKLLDYLGCGLISVIFAFLFLNIIQ